MSPDSIQLLINLHPEVAGALKTIADRHGWTATEAVRQLVSLGYCLDEGRERGEYVHVGNGIKCPELAPLKEVVWP